MVIGIGSNILILRQGVKDWEVSTYYILIDKKKGYLSCFDVFHQLHHTDLLD